MPHRRRFNSKRHWPDGEYRLLASCPPENRAALMRQYALQMRVKLRYVTGRDGMVHIYWRTERTHASIQA